MSDTAIKRTNGIAGQVSITAETDDGRLTFVGSKFGTPGPVVMMTAHGSQTFVTDPGRFGSEFGEGWVRAFLGEFAVNFYAATDQNFRDSRGY